MEIWLGLLRNLVGNDRKPPKDWGYAQFEQNFRNPIRLLVATFLCGCVQKKSCFQGVWNFTKFGPRFLVDHCKPFGQKKHNLPLRVRPERWDSFVLLNHLFCLWELIAIGKRQRLELLQFILFYFILFIYLFVYVFLTTYFLNCLEVLFFFSWDLRYTERFFIFPVNLGEVPKRYPES